MSIEKGITCSYTPGIYAEGYIAFVFPFVRYFPSRSWNLRRSFRLKHIGLRWAIVALWATFSEFHGRENINGYFYALHVLMIFTLSSKRYIGIPGRSKFYESFNLFYSAGRVIRIRHPKRIHLSHDMTKPIKWVCAQRRLRSAWAYAQSDQSLCCALNG